MYNHGAFIILASFKIPWLIWIQLCVLVLLIFLLSYIGLCSVDLPAAGVAQDTLGCSQAGNPEEAQEQRSQDRETNTEANAFSMKDLQRLFHPCYYFELARQAFLQCLGLGRASSNRREQRHDE